MSLYATDDYRYLAQLAGDERLFPSYDRCVQQILAEPRSKGCKPCSEVCRGPPSPNLVAE